MLGSPISVFYRVFFPSRRRHARCLSDWSSDVCSSDLSRAALISSPRRSGCSESGCPTAQPLFLNFNDQLGVLQFLGQEGIDSLQCAVLLDQWSSRSEEHTSELQSL